MSTDSRDAVRVTIQEVAAEAGVSTGTVSRVLNDRSGVRAQTRQAVLEVIERLNYKPDQTARELSFRQATRIGLHFHAEGIRRFSPFHMLFLEHLVSELQTDGYRLEEIPSSSDGLPAYLTDGVVLFGARDDDPRIDYVRERGVPLVLIGHHPGLRWVAPDDYSGGLQATRHLLRLGHESVAHVTGTLAGQGEFDRYRGYRDALGEAGHSPRREHLLDGGFSSLGAYRAVRGALEQGLDFSAVFAASDEMALGVVAAAEDMGLSVPTDLSVVGFDDLPEVRENLTTVRQDISRIAAIAVELLKEGLGGAAVRHEVVPVRLVVRGTTARKR